MNCRMTVLMVAAVVVAPALLPWDALAATAAQPTAHSSAMPSGPDVRTFPELIQRIVTADYEGDRATLDRLYVLADSFLGDPAVESRVRYWKGFAKWRRTMNGGNETPWPDDLVPDLDLAVAELRRSGELDPRFVDARIGEMQCLGMTLFFDRERVNDTALVARLRALMADLKVTAADNPRYVWAWGMAYFNLPPEKGGGPENVIAAYLGALDGIRNGAGRPVSPLDPSWGEAELNVNLAYSYLNKPSPDLARARRYVDRAIEIVPNWHYARDILSKQIEDAEKKAGSSGAAR